MARRRYTKAQKVSAIVAAEASSVLAASEAQGIPESTLRYWMDRPQFAWVRDNAREGIAEESLLVARLAWRKLGEAISNDELEPRDLVIAAGMAADKSQLLNGGATSRSELRDVTGTITDAELIAAIAEAESLTAGIGSPQEDPDPTEG